MYSETASVYLVGQYIDKTMDLKLADFRDKKAMQFDGGAVKSITVKHGDSTFVYQKDAKGSMEFPWAGRRQWGRYRFGEPTVRNHDH